MTDAYASPWKSFADKWEKYYTPPGRPSKEDMAHYKTYVKKALAGKPGKALVLGSTPEIRQVLHTLPVEVTVLDINPEMIEAMNSFVLNAERDTIVHGSWVQNDLPSDYYDVVCGDLSWSNIPEEDWIQFHSTLQRILKPGGHYIHRVQVVPDDWAFEEMQTLVDRFEAMEPSKQRGFELFCILLTNSYDPQDHTSSVLRVWKMLNSVSLGPKTAQMVEDMKAFWGDVDKVWRIGYTDELKSHVTPYFDILEESLSTDYVGNEIMPFWFCKAKK